ncbi:MAG: SGNH/GDSL hydrolase family protein [Bryobacteraceae bacterium]
MRMLALFTACLCWAQQPPDPAMAPIDDQPNLPRVLLIGDSISIGYTLPVRAALAGRANVHRIPENGATSRFGWEKLDSWLGSGKWDVITFNFGLHDLKIMDDGKRQVSLSEYETNLTAIAQRLKRTGATLLFVLTTPVPEGPVDPPRRTADVSVYNRVAVSVMEAERIRVVDLYSAAMARQSELQRPGNVHFTEAGYEALAQFVARAIKAKLPRPHSKPRDAVRE